jgi:hypothetical protein
MKKALGVSALVLNELSISPTEAQYLRHCIGFWNQLVVRQDDVFVIR